MTATSEPIPVGASQGQFPLDGDRRLALIHGQWREGRGGEPIEVFDPSRNTPFFAVTPADAADVDDAVRSSWEAFRGGWARSAGLDRAELLDNLAQAMRDDVDVLGELEARNTGIPIRQSRFEVISAARHFEYFAGLAGKVEGMAADLPDDRLMYGIREPLGVVAQIVPWNTPLKLLARGCAAALACANTVVVKPSVVALASALRWAALVEHAGFPPGVINVVPGPGRSTGAALVGHRDVRKVVFTGGPEGGEQVLVDAARQVTPVLAELGGKGPILVDRNVDVAEVADGVVSQAFARQGQVCFAGTRLFVPATLHDELIAAVASRAERIRVGDALEPATQMGPLITPDHLKTVRSYIDDAVSDGAKVAFGGGPPDNDLPGGNFLRPTMLVDVGRAQRVDCDEVFGPVLTVHRYDDLDQAVTEANDTDFGLASYVWSNDIRTAHRLARELESGNVFVNTYRYASEVPFGGYKRSGIGREHGLEALREYTQLKTVVVGMERWHDPILS